MKKSFILSAATAVLLFVFGSCSNFMDGGEVKSVLDQQIAFANSPSVNVEFRLGDNGAGSIYPNGMKALKEKEEFEIELSLNEGISFTKFLVMQKGSEYLIPVSGLLSINLLAQKQMAGGTVYTFKGVLNTLASNLLITPVLTNEKDVTAPEILDSEKMPFSMEMFQNKKRVPFSSYSASEALYYDFYVLEKENSVERVVKVKYYSDSDCKYKFCEKEFVADVDYLGNGFYHYSLIADFSLVPEIAERGKSYTSVTVSNGLLETEYKIKKETVKKTRSNSSIVVYNSTQYGMRIINESELTAYTPDVKLQLLFLDDWYVSHGEPLSIEWGYTQNKNLLSSIKLKKLTSLSVGVDYDLDVNIGDISKDTYIIVKCPEAMFENNAENVYVLPGVPELEYAKVVDFPSSPENKAIEVGLKNFDPDGNLLTRLHVHNAYGADDVFKSYLEQKKVLSTMDSKDYIEYTAHPYYLQSVTFVKSTSTTDYYLEGPVSDRRSVKPQVSGVISIPSSSEIQIEGGAVDSNRQTIKVKVDQSIYNQFDKVYLTKYVESESSKFFGEASYSSGYICFDTETKDFYDTTKTLGVVSKISRINYDFSLEGVKDGVCYTTDFSIPSTRTLKDNVGPIIQLLATNEYMDYTGSVLCLRGPVLDYGSNFSGNYTFKVRYEGITEAYTEERTESCWWEYVPKIPIGHLMDGYYDIYVTITDVNNNSTTECLKNFFKRRPSYSVNIDTNTTSIFSLKKNTFDSNSYVYSIDTLSPDATSWENKKMGSSAWSNNNTPGFTLAEGFVRAYVRLNKESLDPVSKPIIGHFPILSAADARTTMTDFLTMNNGVLIYTNRGFFVHTLASDIDWGDDISDWESHALIKSNINIPFSGCEVFDGTEYGIICKNGDYTQTPYNYQYPLSNIKTKYAVTIIYFADGKKYLIPVKGY